MTERKCLLAVKYKVKVVDKMSKFEGLKPIWNSLVDKDDDYGYFLSFEWYKLWLEHFLKNNRLNILLLYEEDKLVTIFPLLTVRERHRRIHTKKIVLIGNAYSPIRNVLFNESDSNKKKDYLTFILDYLMFNSNQWDLMELYPLREDKDEYTILKDVIKERGYINKEEDYTENWFDNNLNCSFDEYLGRRSKQFRKQLRRLRNKLEELGKVEIKISTENHNIDEWVNHYYEIYSKSWKKREGIGPLFHGDLAKIAAQSNNFRLGLLFLNDRPIAAEYCIICNSTAHFLKAAYDEEYSFYMPGNIIYYEMVRYLIENDSIGRIDLGHGNDEYKKSVAREKRSLKKIVIFRKNIKGIIIAMLELKLLPSLKKYGLIEKIIGSKLFKFAKE